VTGAAATRLRWRSSLRFAGLESRQSLVAERTEPWSAMMGNKRWERVKQINNSVLECNLERREDFLHIYREVERTHFTLLFWIEGKNDICPRTYTESHRLTMS
jgi:hypothetical protein